IVREHGFSQPLWLDRPEYLFPVPAEITDLAVLAEPLAVSEKGVNEALTLTRARLGADAWTIDKPPRVLITGMGPIAFTAPRAAAGNAQSSRTDAGGIAAQSSIRGLRQRGSARLSRCLNSSIATRG